MKTLEDLQIDNFKIYQDDKLYHFTSDAILLSKFATVKKNDVVADFCSGSGIVGLHLFALYQNAIKSVTFFEMQKSLCELSKETIYYNKLQNNFDAINIKVQDISKDYNEKFSLIVCNPPYMEVNSGESEEDESIAMCRREIALSLKELVKSVNRCLKFGGRFAMVNRADRLADIIYEMRSSNIEPKKIQFVESGSKPPYLLLIEGVKGGKAGIKVLKNAKN